MHKKVQTSGFTIVELLIVIVVIALLAAISIVAYTGIQARARDSQRQQDVKVITQALEMYYLDHGRYPASSCTDSCGSVNAAWSTTNAGNGWENLASHLVPEYISELPLDPNPTMGSNPYSGVGRGYGYFSGNACGTTGRQAYILVYTLEAGAQKNDLIGTCTTGAVGPYGGSSNYRVAVGGS